MSAQPAAISEAPEIQAASPEAEPSPFVSNHVDESEKVAAANAIDPDRAARSAELQKARAVLDDLQKKRELMHEALTELSIKEDELIKAAKEARWGDRDAKLKLSGVDTAATVAADEAVAKHAEKMAQAQAKLDELQEKIEAARAAYNRI